jgi:NAD(P)-dependent dehydrogenase (short-subunit alcohol dehydrogenase family)
VGNATKPSVLIFGASGAIGSACFHLLKADYQVTAAEREYDFFQNSSHYDAVIWAQGKNLTKAFIETSEEDWEDLFEANFTFVRRKLHDLLITQRLRKPARLVFIGSVWSQIARVDKSAYIATKSALSGLTRSLAVELSLQGIAVNCVLPGPVDNLMTRANLTKTQFDKLVSESPTGKLVSEKQVAEVVRFLISSNSEGISGQSIEVDFGWALSKHV